MCQESTEENGEWDRQGSCSQKTKHLVVETDITKKQDK